MSEDVFQMIRSADVNSLEMGLALQCAPVMAGLKVSNLLCISCHAAYPLNKLLTGTGICFCRLCVSGGRSTFLIYRPRELGAWLALKPVMGLLGQLGYAYSDLEEILHVFGNRYHSHMQGLGAFPHEMGLLLGYPVEDVLGFILNKGRNYLYSGYWKVYYDLPGALELFEHFDEVKETAVRWVSRGGSIGEFVNFFINQGGIEHEQNLYRLLDTDGKYIGHGTGHRPGDHYGRENGGNRGCIKRRSVGA